MKKLTSLILTLILMLSLAACGGTTPANDEEEKEPKKKVESSEKTEDAEEVSDISATVENDECSIKITGVDTDNWMGYTLKAQLENKSSEKKYTFTVDSCSINGVKCDAFLYGDISAGKKANEEITFTTETLEENGIKKFTDIELTFRVYDSNDYLAEDALKETVHVYPYGKDKVKKFERKAKSSDNVLVDNENVTVIVTGYEHDEIWGYTANFFLVNKTDKNLYFGANDVSVNGYMIDPFFIESVPAGKCAFSTMSWSDEKFEENDIADVESIEFVLSVSDADDFWADDLVNETFTLNP